MDNDQMDQDGHVVTLSVFLFLSSTEVADRATWGQAGELYRNSYLATWLGRLV
jgi:hypothetical protein